MTHSKRTEPLDDSEEESRIDAWPANVATEPSKIIERVKNVIEARHERGEDEETATDDVVDDLAERDVPQLLEKASDWIAVVGIERVSEHPPVETRPSTQPSEEDVDPRDAILCTDVASFEDTVGRGEQVWFEPFGGSEEISLRLPPGDPETGRYRKGEFYDVHEIARKQEALSRRT